jgi:cysteine desulfurase/selenocysteine lyase
MMALCVSGDMTGLPCTGVNSHYIRMDPRAAPDISAAQFPIMERVIYANHAAISPWPRASVAAVRAFAEESATASALSYPDWLRRESALRALLAKLLNAGSADDIALLKNTTEGVNIAARGIRWRSGDNIVTPDGEFPSNRLAWEALASRGVEVRSVDIRSAENPERSLLEAMDRRTRVLTVSSVAWNDGFRLDLETLGRACCSCDTLFFVDAIQEFGALRMDVRAAHVDCLSAGSHKWQMGPEGMAVFYCSPRGRECLDLSHFGWHMLERPYRHDLAGQRPAAGARRFEAGSPNLLGQAALHASLGLLEAVGLDSVEGRVLDNARRLRAAIGDIPGLALAGDAGPERISGIVSFSASSLPPPLLLQRLKRAGVVAAWRGDAIRLSPHFYQHGAQIEALLDALEHASRSDVKD